MSTRINYIEPKIGEGIYLAKDVAKILHLDYQKTNRWMSGYWNVGGLNENTQYTFGEVGNRAINFLSLIEFYAFFKMREKGLSTIQIKELHRRLSDAHKTEYPFAISQDIFVGDKEKQKIHLLHTFLLV